MTQASRLGQLAWFFGNLYEGVVGLPQLIVDATGRSPGILSAGSPARYFMPIAPFTVVGTALDLVSGWRMGRGADRRAITVEATGLASAVAISAYLIRAVNIPLLTTTEPVSAAQRRQLLVRWHSLNTLRLGCLAAVLMAGAREHRAITRTTPIAGSDPPFR